MSELERQKLSLPTGHDKLLLHSCCAHCSGEVMETLIESGIDFSIFFYNPNIHPVKEYLIRKEENIRFAEKHHIPFIDYDYDTDNRKKVFVVPCVLICVLNVQHYMQQNMALA